MKKMVGIRFTLRCVIWAKVWNRSLCFPVTISCADGETADARYDCIGYVFCSVSNWMIVEGAFADLKWLLQCKRVEFPSRRETNNDKPNSAKMSKTWDTVRKDNTGDTSKIRHTIIAKSHAFRLLTVNLLRNLIRRWPSKQHTSPNARCQEAIYVKISVRELEWDEVVASPLDHERCQSLTSIYAWRSQKISSNWQTHVEQNFNQQRSVTQGR